MRALLDINVLIALLDANHVHHVRATAWLSENLASGWASSPITQNGCIRIMSQPSYPNPRPAALVAERLAEAAASAEHEFWPDDVSLLTPGVLRWRKVLGARQVTDAYLLTLAVRNGGRFITFDAGVPLDAAHGAKPRNLVTL
ncbi:MAG: VapC toxin family PIN domain ribonuclease [Thermoanaerobaculia bacterium]|nr:VapC toxin family PIN domain ribonuclease [Thermoanaerobaculia bacterium]